MRYSHFPILDIATICAHLGVQQAVISPGSRNAPLTIAFVRHPKIQCYSISDERAAAFIALGMAQQSGKPVALVCTSGSAGLNYAPAVAEAYFSQVPLLLLTADRPPEWVNQADGQTIHQRNMYGQHCKAAYEIPADYIHPDALWAIRRTMCEAIHTSTAYPAGPVHINMPFREPFYPKPEDDLTFSPNLRLFEEQRGQMQLPEDIWHSIIEKVSKTPKILLVAGQNRYEPSLVAAIEQLPFALLGDIFANIHTARNNVFRYEIGLQQPIWHSPDLLITFGQSVLSKVLKNRLRQYPPLEHWHIQEAGHVPDVFQSLTRIIRTSPVLFFQTLSQKWKDRPTTDYWLPFPLFDAARSDRRLAQLQATAPLSEPLAVYRLMQALPQRATLHLANSMPVRYAQAIGLRHTQTVEVFCNRGTSGIDGCVSTAVGHALASPNKLHILLVGDVAFLYDRNALWHNYSLPNLRIVVLNNGGGGIFRMIDGPRNLAETDEYFVTQQRLSARSAAEEAGFAYLYANTKEQVEAVLPKFFGNEGVPILLEITTQQADNEQAWRFLQSPS
ncbi:MAG: 2-succinyl-5-enolpyruvyl-6-hydroxy-3-cyclohexene-1-carboxylic-acid synthase [Cytophagales bacterium]|nr:2-succinyl-5-enolpyruvyl-6-hydroxy-3-cyclohexene-1-carboxylic-acid synthase [Bernardetiaceae bacterium]MDW8205352.1 2-succinyl-5-enolpyruvyl-6-hydroxy-3-cyclohexene-1-carboxylic-acid synthase [Cytophagales bacterium]